MLKNKALISQFHLGGASCGPSSLTPAALDSFDSNMTASAAVVQVPVGISAANNHLIVGLRKNSLESTGTLYSASPLKQQTQ